MGARVGCFPTPRGLPRYSGGSASTSVLTRSLRADDSATAIEYSLIVALIAVAIIGGLQTVGSSLNAVFYHVASTLKPIVDRGHV